jgi:hypothetical protein
MKIDHIRGKLQNKARERDVLITKGKALVREAVLEERRTFLSEYDRVSLLEAETFDKKLEQVLGDTNLEAELQAHDDRRADPADTDAGGKEPETQPVANGAASTNGAGGTDGE